MFFIQTILDFYKSYQSLISSKTWILDHSHVSANIIKDNNFVLSTIFTASVDCSKKKMVKKVSNFIMANLIILYWYG